MKFGILVTTNHHLDAVVGLARAAQAKGHEVSIFSMDAGTKLLNEISFVELCKVDGIKMSFCSHNAEGHGVSTSGLPEKIVCGSQYDNAAMNHNADKVIVL